MAVGLYKTETSNDAHKSFRKPRWFVSSKSEFHQKSVIKILFALLAFVLAVQGVASSGIFVFTQKIFSLATIKFIELNAFFGTIYFYIYLLVDDDRNKRCLENRCLVFLGSFHGHERNSDVEEDKNDPSLKFISDEILLRNLPHNLPRLLKRKRTYTQNTGSLNIARRNIIKSSKLAQKRKKSRQYGTDDQFEFYICE